MNPSTDSEKYAGLNLPDLMEMMHTVVYPDTISMSPETIGWQLLGLWTLACALLITIEQIRRYRANRYRREAIRLVSGLDVHNQQAAAEVAILVKRTAIAAFPRSKVAALTGHDWQKFLLQSTQNKLNTTEVQAICSAAYDPKVQVIEVQNAAIRWIRLHRA